MINKIVLSLLGFSVITLLFFVLKTIFPSYTFDFLHSLFLLPVLSFSAFGILLVFFSKFKLKIKFLVVFVFLLVLISFAYEVYEAQRNMVCC